MKIGLEYAQRPRLHLARGGHYESWFLRANHPSEPRAFWIRYTLFVPALNPSERLGEVWAVYFDRERGRPVAAQEDVAWPKCRVESDPLDLRLGESSLRSGDAEGGARGSKHLLQWSLQYRNGNEPLLLLPAQWYERSLPTAKALVSRPLVRFNGNLLVDGEPIVIENWMGSENHNWGRRHTDAYAWGQVCGFDEDKSAFLECASARLRFGPLWSPMMTAAVLRVKDREFNFNRVQNAWRQHADYAAGHWNFTCTEGRCRLRVGISARTQDTVALRYRNPPGGIKTCLNSKLATCELLLERRGAPSLQLRSATGAAFEILTDTPPTEGDCAN